MSENIPRLRMFAGPNGSGKTTVKQSLHKPPHWFGLYVNPDELESTIRETSFISLEPFGPTADTAEVRDFIANSPFMIRLHRSEAANSITCRDRGIDFGGLPFDSYYASVLSDFLRRSALKAGKSFTFETVMSAPDKIELLREAQGRGFRTYLYYIATEDPEINIARVKNRVAEGGHDVPLPKIVARYHRSLALLPSAIRHSSRAFFFDTSEGEAWYFAEMTDGAAIELKSDEIPLWFQSIWDALSAVK